VPNGGHWISCWVGLPLNARISKKVDGGSLKNDPPSTFDVEKIIEK